MAKDHNPTYLKKTDLIDILDRTIGFIRNCDNKAAIFLGTVGVILTIVLTTDGLSSLLSIINSAIKQKSFFAILYLLTMFCAIISILFGLSQMIKVLDATIGFPSKAGLEENSVIFFEPISNNKYLEYKKRIYRTTEEEFLNDITSEIYINACICSGKYKNYKHGLRWTLCGFCVFMVFWAIGTIFFS